MEYLFIKKGKKQKLVRQMKKFKQKSEAIFDQEGINESTKIK